MELLVLILNKTEELEDLLVEFVNIGIKGATVIDSSGMARYLDEMDAIPIFGSFKMLMNKNYTTNKTLFVVLQKDQVPAVIDAVKRIIGDLSAPNVGILFTMPINHVEGGMFGA